MRATLLLPTFVLLILSGGEATPQDEGVYTNRELGLRLKAPAKDYTLRTKDFENTEWEGLLCELAKKEDTIQAMLLHTESGKKVERLVEQREKDWKESNKSVRKLEEKKVEKKAGVCVSCEFAIATNDNDFHYLHLFGNKGKHDFELIVWCYETVWQDSKAEMYKFLENLEYGDLASGPDTAEKKPESGGRDKPAQTGTDEKAYFPVKKGLKWVYRGGTDTTVTVQGSEKLGDHECVVFRGEGGPVSRDHLFGVTEKGVFRFLIRPERFPPLDYKDDPEPLIRFGTKKGETWNWKEPKANREWKFENQGEEEVEVKAGKYKALKIAATWLGSDPELKRTRWFALGVGLIKEIDEWAKTRELEGFEHGTGGSGESGKFRFDAWKSWNAFQEGSMVQFETVASGYKMMQSKTLAKKESDVIQLKTEMEVAGNKNQNTERVERNPAVGYECPLCRKPIKDHVDAGTWSEEIVKVGEKEFKCHKYESPLKACDGKEYPKFTTWYSEEVPGGIVKQEGQNYKMTLLKFEAKK